jgi:hypothetical protein
MNAGAHNPVDGIRNQSWQLGMVGGDGVRLSANINMLRKGAGKKAALKWFGFIECLPHRGLARTRRKSRSRLSFLMRYNVPSRGRGKMTANYLGALALLLATTVFAAADSKTSVDNAMRLCATIDATGLVSKPCSVSGWNSTVDATIDMNSSEARNLCHKLVESLRSKAMRWDKGWTLKIYSPYSGSNSIAFCNLPG